MDRTDQRIISHLQRHGRDSYREMAKILGLAPATVMNRVKQLEREGVIRGYSALLDYDKLGFEIHVIIDVRVAKGKLHQIEKKIARDPSVLMVFDNTGPFDATVLARFRNRGGLDRFIKKLQTYDFVERTETKLILNTIKDEGLKIL
ncbi:MAG: Lrp/AsnC family transcriptional regulator [Thermoplasmatota archaeon]